MGVGKTSTGRKLSGILGIRFTDMDAVIEEQEGMSVQEIFNQKGEEWFRNKETEVLKQLSVANENLIIATGGGTPCFNENMEIINATGISFYLQMSPVALVKRLTRTEKRTRPLIAGKTDEELIEYIQLKLSEREQFYLKSKFIIPADNIRIEDIVSNLKL